MRENRCDVLIVGGGTGGAAAALAALSLGVTVTLTEETDWLGGQLSAQIVPPDEHPWIEEFGRTRRYAEFRQEVRRRYGNDDPDFNPGGGWVSRLCFAPRLGHEILADALAPYVESGKLMILYRHVPVSADCSGDEVRSVTLLDTDVNQEVIWHAEFILDATETGDLLPMTLTEYRLGSEAQSETGEPSAPDEADPQDLQAFTHVFAMAYEPSGDFTIERPENYDRWRAYRPAHWPGPLLGFDDLDPVSNEARHLPFDRLFTYRQIVTEPIPVTAVNWPMNDFMEGRVVEVDDAVRDKRLAEAKELSLSLLYWLQTEEGHRTLRLAPEISGTPDGFAKTVYHREGRRIRARTTIYEEDVATDLRPGELLGTRWPHTVGVGAYRIDLHPSAAGRPYLDLSTLPFHIPLGALVPERVENLIPAAKNIGTTHITNGCYRLHPVEWNIGEVAGLLAGFCHLKRTLPASLLEDETLFDEFASLMNSEGIETAWPDPETAGLRPL